MEKKSKPKHRPRGCCYLRGDSPFYRIAYSASGRRYRENTKCTTLKEARKLLDSRLGVVAVGGVLPIDMNKTSVAELLELVRGDYRAQNLKSLADMERRIRLHLGPHFLVLVDEKGNLTGGMRVTQVTTDGLNRYVHARQEAGATNGSINRELSILRRGFTLGEEATPAKVLKAPKFPRLKESAPRKGFLEDSQFDAIVRGGEVWFRCICECARTFGWRVTELQQLRCEQVDLVNRTIRLNVGETKNNDGRLAIMTAAVHTLLSALLHGKKGTDYVFTRTKTGKPVKDFRATWRQACVAAGVGHWHCPKCEGLKVLDAEGKCEHCGETWKRRSWRYRGSLFHDWRRTGVRAMVRRGIPERVAMTISGHRTRSVFERYNIVSEQDLREAARKMSEPLPAVPLVSVSYTVDSAVADKTVN